MKELEKRFNFLKSQREKTLAVWRDISRFVAPYRGNFDGAEPNQGTRRDEFIIDSAAGRALSILQAGMQGGLTSPSRPWFRLQASDPALNAVPSVMRWVDAIREGIIATLGQSNIYNCLHGLYGEIAAFGTGAVIIEDDWEQVVSGVLMTAGDFFVSYGAGGSPDAFGRELWMTAGQIEERGWRASDQVKNALANGTPDKWFKINHLIFKDRERVRAAYWEPGNEEALFEGTHPEFPALVPRWETAGADWYGYSPGWHALPESKQLQEMARDYLVALKMAIKPPLMAPAEARNERVSLNPGVVNYVAAPTPYTPVVQTAPDIPGQLQSMQFVRERINQIFFADIFLMIAGMDNRNMTATEVQVRQEEKMQMLGPVIERLEHELLDPLIMRVFNIMDRRGMFPSPPDGLAGQSVKIEYVSMMAVAQRAAGMGEIGGLLSLIGGIAQMAPEVADKLDADEAVDQYVRVSGIPPAIVRPGEEVQAIREGRAQAAAQQAQAQQAAAQMETLKTGASAARDLSKGAEPGSVMEGLMGNGIETPE